MGPRNDKGDINAALGQRAALRGPTETIFENPFIEPAIMSNQVTRQRDCKPVLVFLSEAQFGRRDTLKDIVVVLGGAEHGGRRVRHVPAWQMRSKFRPGVGRSLTTQRLRLARSKTESMRAS